MTESETNMTTTPPPPPPKKSLWRRLLKWTLRLAIFLLAVGLLGWSIANYYVAKSIRTQIAQLRTDHQPLTFAELDAGAPKIAWEDDAAPYYAAALALIHYEESFPEYDQATKTGRITPEMLAEARRRVEANRLVLEMLDRGSGLPGCNSDLGLRYGISACLPTLNKARGVANAASMRTRLLAFQGQGDQAVQSAISSLGMPRVFDRQPILIAFLVKIGCTAMFCRDVAAVLEHGQPSDKALRELGDALSQAEPSLDVRRTFVAERVYFLELSRDLIGGGRSLKAEDNDAAPLPLPEAKQMQAGSGLPLRAMLAQNLPHYQQFAEAAALDWPRMLDAARGIQHTQFASRFDFFGPIIIPSFVRAIENTGRVLAEIRSARVAIAIERYRLAHGQLPDSLNQLPASADLPTDPFTGQSLIYRKTDDGYCVYSLGETRQDAGGKDLNARGPNWGIRVRTTPAATQPAR